MPPVHTLSLLPARPCGGGRAGAGCKAEMLDTGQTVQFDIKGSAYGESHPVTADRIEAVWFSAKLVGDIPGLGRVIFSTWPGVESTVRITTLQAGYKSALRRAGGGNAGHDRRESPSWGFKGSRLGGRSRLAAFCTLIIVGLLGLHWWLMYF